MGCTTDSTDTDDSRTIFPTPPTITEHQTVDTLPEQTPLTNVVENALETNNAGPTISHTQKKSRLFYRKVIGYV